MTQKLLRAFAILIAFAAIIDPSFTSVRRTKPLVAVVAADTAGDGALVRSVSRALEKDFTLVHAMFAGAEGAVVVGHAVPDGAADLPSPVFGVFHGGDGPVITIERVDAPARAALESRVTVAATAHVMGARGRTMDVSLRAGDLVLDRATRQIRADDEAVPVTLTFVPTAAGAAALRVTAEIASQQAATSDVMLDVRDERRAVLFFDRRPSWMSTFVRRAVERDPRFVVTSRVVTSRNISTDAGAPPPALDDLAPLALFDAVVVGAPEALTERDVAGLDAFLRRRGGSVVLLLDQRIAGPYERLTDAGEWSDLNGDTPLGVDPAKRETGSLRASDLAWPVNLPPGARALAMSVPTSRNGTIGHPVVWESPVGAGRLIVSGALDAWTARDPAVSGFEAFWQSTIGAAANLAPAAIDIDVARAPLRPGEMADVSVTLQGASLAGVSRDHATNATISATLDYGNRHDRIQLWPDGPSGQFRGTVRAPSMVGVHRVVVAADGARTDVPLVVAAGASHPMPDERDLVSAWTHARGGSTVTASELDQLPARLRSALRNPVHAETWRPMRSPWWIIPFALALGAEWFLRRRRGLA